MQKRTTAKPPLERRGPRLVAAGLPSGPGARTWQVPPGLVALLGLSFVFLLVTAAVVILPARALPARVAEAIDGRRESLLFFALCAVGAGLVLALLAALATS